MWKYLLLLITLCVGILGWYGLVFSSNIIFSQEIHHITLPDNNIYLWEKELSSNYVAYRSNTDISHAKVISNCNISFTFLESYQDLYFFELDYSQDANCSNGSYSLKLGEDIVANASWKFHLKTWVKLLDYLVDLDSNTLHVLLNQLEKNIKKDTIYKNYAGKHFVKYIRYVFWKRRYHESVLQRDLILDILAARKEKYIIPVLGRKISESHSKIPNAWRPYRQDYTDGIHHGWDINGDIWEDIVALDDGIIVRIVDIFSDNDFKRIQYGDNLSEEQKNINLDILRGKQVWLKTMKGDVVFYSHMTEIDANISEWVLVKKWQRVGTTGVTWVPEKWYDDYHLHFAVMKNPYTFEKAGTYNFWDYMAWDWITKGLNREETITIQKEIFE